MSYLDDAALHEVVEKRIYFFRVNKEDVWYRVVLSVDFLPQICWGDYEEVIELQSDGTGKYIQSKKHPFKEGWFYKMPEDVTLIALKAKSR